MIDQESAKSSVVKKISPLLHERLQQVVRAMRRSQKAQVYDNGALVQYCDEEDINLMKLSVTTSGDCEIVRFEYSCRSLFRNTGFTRVDASEVVNVSTQHAACDLYLKACKMFHPFQRASSRSLQRKAHKVDDALSPSPVPWDGTEPDLLFKESDFMRRAHMKPSQLISALGLGGTGAGKTHSYVRPVLDSVLRYRLVDGKTYSALVIDPKAELLTSVRSTLESLGEAKRLLVLGQCPPVRFFSDSDCYSTNDRFEKLRAFVIPSSSGHQDDRWQRFSDQLVQALLNDDQRFFDATGLPLFECLCALVYGDLRYMELSQWRALREIFCGAMGGVSSLKHWSDCYDVLALSVGIPDMDCPLSRYLNLSVDGADQWFYNARGALGVIEPFAGDDIDTLIDLSVRRGNARSNTTSLVDVINRGQVLVFQPTDRASHALAGKALKSLFFQSAMARQDMLRPIAYVSDEWQRFITVDPESGDHNFLDRCRAYRVTVLVATQSVAALQLAMGSGNEARDAVTSLLINLPTKVVFRTPCVQTVEAMKGYIPMDPGGDLHILQCRPPSALLTGEYYFTNAEDWGRTRHSLPGQ
jgi:hypothetical protein